MPREPVAGCFSQRKVVPARVRQSVSGMAGPFVRCSQAQNALPQTVRQSLEIASMDAYTLVGFVGVGCIVVAYFANQQGWLKAEDWRFPTANLVGSLLIMASLWTAWNFPSAVIEAIWAAISLYGLVRRWR